MLSRQISRLELEGTWNWLIRTTTISIVQPKSYSTNDSIVIFIKHHTQASLFIMTTLSKTIQLSGIFYFDLSTVPSIQRNKLYVQIHILKADEHLLLYCDGVVSFLCIETDF